MDLNIRQVYMPDIIKSCVEEQDAELQHHKIKIDMNVSPDICNILCDKNRIFQVVMSLLSNAIKYSPKGAVITITVRMARLEKSGQTKGKMLQVSLED